MTKLIFGCGYLGSRVARQWRDAGEEVAVVTRSAEKSRQLCGEGFRALVADVTLPETLAELPAAETVLMAVGFDRAAGGSIHDVYVDGMRNVLAALPEDTGRLIYISTTGVYGRADGDWVDEHSPTAPHREGGQASLEAEHRLAEHSLAAHAIVLRMAGLYGPGRIPYQEKLRANQPLAVPSEGWLNLIHVDDAARVVVAAGQWEAETDGPHCFCVSDGTPVVRGDYYRAVAQQIGAPGPRFALPDARSPAAARAAANRRISNRKLLQTLPIQLLYPSYREGLAEALS